jgi:cell division protein FtsI/penicillin-binding protein 2
MGPLLVMWAASVCLLVRQRDLGCALVFFCVFLAVLHAATSRWAFVALGLGLFSGAAYMCYPRFSHLAVRVTAWLDPWPHIDGDAGYQIIQSLFALASGGSVGTGIGRGLPENIPVVESDFIFAALAEELGYVGAAAVCLAFALLVVRAVVHARRSRSAFTSLLATGLAAGIGVQAAIIIAGVTKAIPMTGITLPFVSYGGSSLVAGGIALGVLLSLSAESNAAAAAQQMPVEGPLRVTPGPIGKAHVAAFAALTVWIGYWQIYRGPELTVHPRNPRLAAMESKIERGSIADRNGETLAENGDVPGKRVYPGGTTLSHIVGYRDDQYGLGGLEAGYGGYLLGLARPRGGILDVLSAPERRDRGYDLRLTLDLKLQRRAWELLGDRRGGVVAIEPSTGNILALVGKPSFDPHDVARAVGGESAEATLLNRATQGLYPPGSSFKILVAAAALDARAIDESFTVTCRGTEVIHDDRIRCWKQDGHGTIALREGLAQSCNIYFANVGLKLGPGRFTRYARAFGFGERVDIGIPVTPSSVPSGDRLYTAMLLESSFGQGEVQVTPLQMAWIAATIANHGEQMELRLLDAVLDGDEELSGAGPRRRGYAVSARAADQVTQLMRYAVESGTAGSGGVPGVTTAGKTGTAENPHGDSHAWYVGFAPAADPKIAVAVVAENAGSGGTVAGPIARGVMQEWLADK